MLEIMKHWIRNTFVIHQVDIEAWELLESLFDFSNSDHVFEAFDWNNATREVFLEYAEERSSQRSKGLTISRFEKFHDFIQLSGRHPSKVLTHVIQSWKSKTTNSPQINSLLWDTDGHICKIKIQSRSYKKSHVINKFFRCKVEAKWNSGIRTRTSIDCWSLVA